MNTKLFLFFLNPKDSLQCNIKQKTAEKISFMVHFESR